MTPRERIRLIRLVKKLEKHPAYAKALGIEAVGAEARRNRNDDPKGLTNG